MVLPMPSAPARVPAGVVALGAVSLLMDASSEMIHSILPLLLVTGLGASAMMVGVIEGLAEATAMVVKVFSGVLSDALRRRKPLVVAGYALAALSKPLFPLAHSAALVLAARLIDRVGKGIRGAPRDALIADLTPTEVRGAAYGMRQALDSVGAIVGPAAAIALMVVFAGDLRTVLWLAAVPAVLAVALLVVAVREPPAASPRADGQPAFRLSDLRALSRRYWWIVGLGAVLTLARFSEAFLILDARHVGFSEAWVPMVMVLMNVVYAALAYPAGRLADRVDKAKLMSASLLALIAADLVLAFAASRPLALVGAGLWGMHMALSQGLLAQLVAEAAPAALRGSAFGVFNLVSGGALLVASTVAGALWTASGPTATFLAGALFAAIALSGLLWRQRLAR